MTWVPLRAQVNAIYTPADSLAWEAYKVQLADKVQLPAGEFLAEVGMAMRGTPYVHHPIEVLGPERLVANLRRVDCVTFVDNAMALARSLQADAPSFAGYMEELQQLRYQNGQSSCYGDRYHYVGHLLLAQQQAGKLQVLNGEVGAVAFNPTVNFMTKRRHKYPHLVSKANFMRVRSSEELLTETGSYFIPKKQVAEQAHLIKNGDLIGITSSVDGMDITHFGIAYWLNGRLHMLHASRDFKKVMVTPNALPAYLANKRQMGGIVVARVTENYPSSGTPVRRASILTQ